MTRQAFSELNQVQIWGNPYHGLLRNGYVELPNGQLRMHAEPYAAGPLPAGYRELHGYTFCQRMPWATPVERSAEQLAQDSADGMEWRSEFIVSGGGYLADTEQAIDMMIYGRRVGGWIYAAPDGSRWLVSGGSTARKWLAGGTITLPLTFRRFGDIGGPQDAVQASVSITAAAAGQLTPVISGVNGVANVFDITPSGDRAIVRLTEDNAAAYVLGWLELSIAGHPQQGVTVELSVLRTRSETLGRQTVSNDAVLTRCPATPSYNETTDDQRGAFPNCGHIDLINEYYWPAPAAIDNPQSGLYGGIGAMGTNRLERIGHIIAMWYGDGGAPEPVEMDIEEQVTYNSPVPSYSVEGIAVTRHEYPALESSCSSNPNVIPLEWAMWGVSLETQIDELSRIALRHNGITISDESTRSITRQHSRTDTVGNGPAAIPGNSSSVETLTTYTTRHNGEVVEVQQSTSNDLTFNYERFREDTLVRRIETIGAGGRARALRYSNKLVGIKAMSTMMFQALDPYVTPAITPSGIAAPTATTTLSYAANDYGSYNPVTQQAEFPSETPVNWT